MIELDYIIPEINLYSHRNCSPTWIIEKSIIDFHDLTYIAEGCGTYIVDGEVIPVEKGDIIYIPAYCQREACTSADNLMELYAVNFFLLDNKKVTNDTVLPFKRVSKLGIHQQLISNFRRMTVSWVEKDKGYIMETRAIFLNILSDLIKELYYSQQIFSFDKRIENIKNYIHNHYGEFLTLEQLAEEVNLNHIYFGALFKKTMGCSVKEYINLIRVNNAEIYLKTEKMSIVEVANKCGFDDAFYFSKVFKKYKGCSPSKVEKIEKCKE